MSSSQQPPKGLLLFSIGPVQDFIKTARRTQDLWMGSYILAYLSYVAMEIIRKTAKYDWKQPNNDVPDPILFPVLDNHPFPKGRATTPEQRRQLTIASLPNKFTVRIDSVEQGELFARRAKERVYNVWREISASVQAKIPGTPGTLLKEPPDWAKMWQEQIAPEKWLEVYWVIYPNPGQQYDFGRLNTKAEQALQARKGIRSFTPLEEKGERDTLSGRWAALSDPPQQPRRQLRRQWQTLAEALYREGVKEKGEYSGLSAALSTEGHEYLSAIALTKRFAQRFCFQPHWELEGKFPSTSSIASAVFRQELLGKSELKAARTQFVTGLRSQKGEDGHTLPETLSKDSLPLLFETYPNNALLKFDGELFYPDTYTEKRLKDDFNVDFTENAAANLKQNLLDLRAAAAKAGINMPPTYYALLLMDGDKMGKHLKKIKTEAGQREVSRRLMDFGLQEVQKIVEDTYLGRVVYAGGDDLMAFLPLENVLAAVEALNQAYRQALGAGYTASAGVAIAHHLAPLDRVLDAARAAEGLAKGRYGRDSIVFSILKRSGEQLDVGAKWDFDGQHAILPVVQKIRDYLQDEKIGLSPKFAFDAQEEAAAITGMAEAHKKRLALLLKRHTRPGQLKDKAREELAAELAAIGVGIHGQLNAKVPSDDDDRPENQSGTVEVARWLLLARFLAAAMAGED